MPEPSYFSFLRHLRHLLRSSEELIQTPPTLASLKNESTACKNEICAIQTELATVAREKDLDSARIAEEKDGHLNET